MNATRVVSVLALAAALFPAPYVATAQDALPPEPPVRYDADFADPAFHAGRRALLLKQMPDTAMIAIPGAPQFTRDNDIKFEYRQDSDLYYLTGATEPGSILLLIPHGAEIEGETVREILFVPERTDFSDTWLGRRFGPKGARSVLGLDAALPLSAFEPTLTRLMESSSSLYVLPWAAAVPQESDLAQQVEVLLPFLQADPDAEIRSLRLRRALDDMRSVKQPEELRLMQRAIDATEEALKAAMRAARPGMHEYELEGLIEYVFRREGAESPAFASIVGSHENAVILHYESNRRQMQEDELVLMDVGAEFRGYAADVTRTIPVDGSFSAEQAAIYQLVLDAQEAGIAAARAGYPVGATHAAASEVLAAGLRELGILHEDGDVMEYLQHGTTHYLGLSVHDVRPGIGQFEAGNVITVEPGLYFKPSPELDPKWWNIGVRIEDDVLITDGDPVVLSKDAPKSIEDIEALMLEECALPAADCG